MEIILDADIIIRAEKGRFNLAAWSSEHLDDELVIAAITIAEVWHGVWRAGEKHQAQRSRFLTAALRGMPVAPYSDATAHQHAKLWAELEGSGKMIGYYDLIVASTALARKAAVATFNVRHFSRVKGLTVLEPTVTQP